jgi:hypothetical protein
LKRSVKNLIGSVITILSLLAVPVCSGKWPFG